MGRFGVGIGRRTQLNAPRNVDPVVGRSVTDRFDDEEIIVVSQICRP